jgi:hypothetical protein
MRPNSFVSVVSLAMLSLAVSISSPVHASEPDAKALPLGAKVEADEPDLARGKVTSTKVVQFACTAPPTVANIGSFAAKGTLTVKEGRAPFIACTCPKAEYPFYYQLEKTSNKCAQTSTTRPYEPAIARIDPTCRELPDRAFHIVVAAFDITKQVECTTASAEMCKPGPKFGSISLRFANKGEFNWKQAGSFALLSNDRWIWDFPVGKTRNMMTFSRPSFVPTLTINDYVERNRYVPRSYRTSCTIEGL